MAKLSFWGLKVTYLVFLLAFPDVTVDARTLKRISTEGRKSAESYELVLSHRQKRGIGAIIRVGVGATATVACMSVIFSNMGCGGLQKDICDLRKEVATKRNKLKADVKNVRDIEDKYQSFQDKVVKADGNNQKILGKLQDSIDMTAKYVKLLKQIKDSNIQIPDPPKGFYTLDTRIETFLVNLDTIPSSASTWNDAKYYLIGLGIELLPIATKFIYKKIDKTTWPKTFDMSYVRKGRIYGVSGNQIFEVNSRMQPLRRASFSAIGKASQPKSWPKLRAGYEKFQALSNSWLGKAVQWGVSLAGLALCGWHISEIVKQNANAKALLNEQKTNITGFLQVVAESKKNMTKAVDGVTTLLANQTNNFRILLNTLVSSKTFNQVATQSERTNILKINGTATTSSNFQSQQSSLISFLITYYNQLKAAYDEIRKLSLISEMVSTDISVDNMVKQLKLSSITVSGKLEVFQIIAKIFKDKATYGGIALTCIRTGKISTEAQLEAALSKTPLPQNVISQIITLSMAQVPPTNIAAVINGRFTTLKEKVTEAMVLDIIANDVPAFKDKTEYVDFMTAKYDLTKYRGAKC